MSYTKRTYSVPSDRGRRVRVAGKPGIIVGDDGPYISVNFDADKPNVFYPCHPTHLVEYLEMGTVRKMTRSQARYQRWLKCADCFETFMDFCRYDSQETQ